MAMKISRILSIAGLIALLSWSGAAFAQTQIPVGAGVGVDRQPAGSRFREHARRHHHVTADRGARSMSCSQQAKAKGLHGKAGKSFRSKCKRSGGR
jgi:hypothetical protein